MKNRQLLKFTIIILSTIFLFSCGTSLPTEKQENYIPPPPVQESVRTVIRGQIKYNDDSTNVEDKTFIVKINPQVLGDITVTDGTFNIPIPNPGDYLIKLYTTTNRKLGSDTITIKIGEEVSKTYWISKDFSNLSGEVDFGHRPPGTPHTSEIIIQHE
jgi:hypothetical protein